MIQLWTERRPLFNVMVENSSITENILMVYVIAAREDFTDRIIDEIIFIQIKFNYLVDSLTVQNILLKGLHGLENEYLH